LILTLPSDRVIVMSRLFEAPRDLVFEAWTRPEHVKQWYGCRGSTMLACEIDLRIGGVYRFTIRGPDGKDYTATGVYREIVPPRRLVYTEGYVTEGIKSNVALVTVIFEEQLGRTRMTSTSLYASKEDRDGRFDSGVERGATETLDRLAAHLVTMARAV
jgi:uncharacterized protein YndB with AHSA1/START domain